MLRLSRVRVLLLSCMHSTNSFAKGIKRLEDGSTVKEWNEEEQQFAAQATVSEVTNEDVRYMVSLIRSLLWARV